MNLARIFADHTVARLYHSRPPYPDRVFAALARRIALPRTVLDPGAGTWGLQVCEHPDAELRA